MDLRQKKIRMINDPYVCRQVHFISGNASRFAGTELILLFNRSVVNEVYNLVMLTN